MLQQQQEHPVQQQHQMRQRYMRTRLQTNSMNGRSSSNSRNSNGNSREMDPMTRSENYKYVCHTSDIQIRLRISWLRLYSYIRSSEDISSGYSSAEPMPISLSRTTSLTNTAAIKLKAKRSEVSVTKFIKLDFI